jgi:hypothetical protein
MTTTFEKFKGTKRGNYCTLPTIDVEIIDPAPYCRYCDGEMVYNPTGDPFGHGRYEHKAEPEPGTCKFGGQVASRCTYCGTNEKGVVTFSHESWSDETSCSRCGGVHGYAIGD